MSYHTRTSLLVHCAYIGGIARTNNMKALAVGGMPDHLHVLLSLPPDMTVSKAMQLVKPGSSKAFAFARDGVEARAVVGE